VAGQQQQHTRFVLPKSESYAPTDGIDTATQGERRFGFVSALWAVITPQVK